MSEYNEPKAQSTQANVLQGVEAKKKKKNYDIWKVQLSSKSGNEVKVKTRPNLKIFSNSPGTKSSKT